MIREALAFRAYAWRLDLSAMARARSIPTTALGRWLQDNGLTHLQFAQMAGVGRPVVDAWVAGGVLPCRANIQAITRVTFGEVSKEDIYRDAGRRHQMEWS